MEFGVWDSGVQVSHDMSNRRKEAAGVRGSQSGYVVRAVTRLHPNMNLPFQYPHM